MIVDATLISSSRSTKSKDNTLDSEMYQMAKRRQWRFRISMHVGIHSRTKFIHATLAAANAPDMLALSPLPHGRKNCWWGDQG